MRNSNLLVSLFIVVIMLNILENEKKALYKLLMKLWKIRFLHSTLSSNAPNAVDGAVIYRKNISNNHL